jgi:hypothetical protein
MGQLVEREMLRELLWCVQNFEAISEADNQ